MKYVQTEVTEQLVVLGAKPNSALPDVAAPYVLGANGAIEVGLPYREKYQSKLIGLVPGVELYKHAHIRDSIKKAYPEELIVFGDGGKDIVLYIHNEMGLANTKVTLLTIKERIQLMKAVLGIRTVLVAAERFKVRGLKHFLKTALPDMLRGGDMAWMAHSTGLDAIMYAMLRFPNASHIITAGIGLQGGEHFNQQGEFMSKTAIADRGTMRHWKPALRPQVYTTDVVMHECGKVPLWTGKYFEKM